MRALILGIAAPSTRYTDQASIPHDPMIGIEFMRTQKMLPVPRGLKNDVAVTCMAAAVNSIMSREIITSEDTRTLGQPGILALIAGFNDTVREEICQLVVAALEARLTSILDGHVPTADVTQETQGVTSLSEALVRAMSEQTERFTKVHEELLVRLREPQPRDNGAAAVAKVLNTTTTEAALGYHESHRATFTQAPQHEQAFRMLFPVLRLWKTPDPKVPNLTETGAAISSVMNRAASVTAIMALSDAERTTAWNTMRAEVVKEFNTLVAERRPSIEITDELTLILAILDERVGASVPMSATTYATIWRFGELCLFLGRDATKSKVYQMLNRLAVARRAPPNFSKEGEARWCERSEAVPNEACLLASGVGFAGS